MTVHAPLSQNPRSARVSFTSDLPFTVDIDECLIGSDDCDEFANCEDLDGSYTCQCMEGYFSESIAREGTCFGKMFQARLVSVASVITI